MRNVIHGFLFMAFICIAPVMAAHIAMMPTVSVRKLILLTPLIGAVNFLHVMMSVMCLKNAGFLK